MRVRNDSRHFDIEGHRERSAGLVVVVTCWDVQWSAVHRRDQDFLWRLFCEIKTDHRLLPLDLSRRMKVSMKDQVGAFADRPADRFAEQLWKMTRRPAAQAARWTEARPACARVSRLPGIVRFFPRLLFQLARL